MTTIYFKPHKSRLRERAFCRMFQDRLPDARVVQDSFPIRAEWLDVLLDTASLKAALRDDKLLPVSKRRKCIEILDELPPRLQVARSISRVSNDLVIQRGDDLFVWEFHEEQHRRLTVNRLTPVYDERGNELRIPRFVQRLIRDIWRICAIGNLTIVWSDWFSKHAGDFDVRLRQGFREYALPGSFAFGEFLKKSRGLGTEVQLNDEYRGKTGA